MDSGYLKLQITLEESLLEEDMPKSLSVFLSDHNTWQSIGEFSVLQPKLFSIPVVKNQPNGYTIKVTSHVTIYHKGVTNVTHCQVKLLETANCSKICYPIRFNYIHNVPCNSIQETLCTSNSMSPEKNIECLVPKQITDYQGESRYVAGFDMNETSLQIGVTFEVAKKEVKEEVYVLGFRAYIGSVGGSLGMFLGFSVYSFYADFLDIIFKIF